MDWQKLRNELTEQLSNEWFKPQAGQVYQIVFLDEGELIEKVFEGEKYNAVRFLIEANKKQRLWDVSVSKTYNSLFGQLVVVAADAGKALGMKITMSVMGEGKSRRYFVQEAMVLMPAKEEKIL